MHVFRSQRVLTPTGLAPLDVVTDAESILQLCGHGSQKDCAVTDFGDALLAPGLIDAHCHINDPGRAHWEGFDSATRAAAAGGITLLCDMPLNSDPVTTEGSSLDQKIAAAEGQLRVDVAFYGGLVPDNANDLQRLRELSRAGVAAFKCFLCDSGLASFEPVDRRQLENAMPEIQRLGKRLLAHAEYFDHDHSSASPTPSCYAETVEARPEDAELRAIELLAELCESTGCAVHIVHLSAASALPKLAQLRALGLPITVETCPHYLTFCSEELSLDPTNKCAPPMRDRANREALWQGLASGTIDFIATDHSPCPPELKFVEADDPGERWIKAWGGIASLQLLLPTVATEAFARGHSAQQVCSWLSQQPAAWLGLDDRGSIEVGKRADFVAWHPERSFKVSGQELEHRHAATPYEGLQLQGVVQGTVLGGQLIYGSSSDQSQPSTYGSALRLRHGNLADSMTASLRELNALGPAAAATALAACCGAEVWVRAMASRLPFTTTSDVALASERAFDQLSPADWHQAFSAHPRIGDLASLQKKYAATKSLASHEQSSTHSADQETLQALALGNAAYESKFGHVFLVCASGRSASSMLAELEGRLTNSPETEFRIACEEQRKITYLRLQGAPPTPSTMP